MELTNRKQNIPWFIIGLLAGALIAVNIIRVWKVTITHDEALTYEWYVTHTIHDIISSVIPSANNHVLNSVLAKLSLQIFGDHLFFLRLPSLLAHIGYMMCSILISRRLFKDAWWVLGCFMLLQLNPFMFEFWGLARGYALSMAFMMGAVYCLLRFLEKPGMGWLVSLYLCLFFGVFANFVLLNVLIAVSCIIFIFWLSHRKTMGATGLLVAAILCGAAILLSVYEPIRILVEKQQLYFGGDTGFIHDTMNTLIVESMYLSPGTDVSLVSVMLICIVLLSGVYCWYIAIRERNFLQTGLVLWLLLAVPAISVVLQHHVLDSKYLVERTALFFYPLFILSLLYTLAGTGKIKHLVLITLSVAAMANFAMNINLSHSRTWEFDKYDKWLLRKMMALKENEGAIKIYLDGHFSPAFRYYVNRDYPGKFGHIEGHLEMAYEKLEYDFYLVKEIEVHKVPDIYTLDTTFYNGTFYLYKRKKWDN